MIIKDALPRIESSSATVPHHGSVTAAIINEAAAKSPGWMANASLPGKGPYLTTTEVISLSALIRYAASKTKVSEFRTERELADRFHVANIKRLPTTSYDDAIRFLTERVRPYLEKL